LRNFQNLPNVYSTNFKIFDWQALKTAYQIWSSKRYDERSSRLFFLGSGLRDDATSTGGGGGDVIEI
jgi:hypothetical protein